MAAVRTRSCTLHSATHSQRAVPSGSRDRLKAAIRAIDEANGQVRVCMCVSVHEGQGRKWKVRKSGKPAETVWMPGVGHSLQPAVCPLYRPTAAQDPSSVTWEGQRYPYRLLYSQWVTEWVQKLDPKASDELLILARGEPFLGA